MMHGESNIKVDINFIFYIFKYVSIYVRVHAKDN
jgi:hypothetical protein